MNNAILLNQMISELYEKFILKPPKPKKEVKPSLRRYFIQSYKDGKYREFSPFKLDRGNIDEITNTAAQITYKLLTDDQKKLIEKDFKTVN